MNKQTITMTDEDFRYWHYKLWDWLAETGESDKSLFDKFKELGDLNDNGVELHFAVFDAYDCDCFACGADTLDRLEKGIYCCSSCPIDWGCDCIDCCDDESLFSKWDNSRTIEDRKMYAKLISQLPWRGKERDE